MLFSKITEDEITKIKIIFKRFWTFKVETIGAGQTDDFLVFIENHLYVDKTRIIRFVINNFPMFICAPQRWGKSLIISMLEYFLQPDAKILLGNNKNAEKFKKLNIFKENELIEEDGKEKMVNFVEHYQGKFPVIKLNFKSVTGDDEKEIKIGLQKAIAKAYKDHSYLIEKKIDSQLKKIKNLYNINVNFEDHTVSEKWESLKLITHKIGIEIPIEIKNLYLYYTGDNKNLLDSIGILSEFLDEYYKNGDIKNKKPIIYILVDEYDKPIHRFLKNIIKIQDKEEKIKEIKKLNKISTFITKIIGTKFKGKTLIKNIILTGIFNTVDLEASTVLNSLKEKNFMTGNFTEYFGFNSDEVKEQILNKIKVLV